MNTSRDGLDLLATATEPSSEAVDRLVARVAAQQIPAERRSVRIIITASGLVPAAVALALFVGGVRGADEPVPTQRMEAAAPTAFEPVPRVAGVLHGSVTLTGTQKAPRFLLESGMLDLEVEPGRGLRVTVETDEAKVAVHGTAFRVVRDALGTTVSVQDGVVETTCGKGRPTRLSTDAAMTCLPVRPSGLLGRARALHRSGASEDALYALELAQAASSPGTPVRGEVLAQRVNLLLALGRTGEAVAVARTYLGEGHTPRIAEMQVLAGQRPPPH